jgi:hypothetical protein
MRFGDSPANIQAQCEKNTEKRKIFAEYKEAAKYALGKKAGMSMERPLVWIGMLIMFYVIQTQPYAGVHTSALALVILLAVISVAVIIRFANFFSGDRTQQFDYAILLMSERISELRAIVASDAVADKPQAAYQAELSTLCEIMKDLTTFNEMVLDGYRKLDV